MTAPLAPATGLPAAPASRWQFLPAAMAAAGFALTVITLYPGYMTNDATYVYGYMRDWSFGDWQSPLMSMLWRLVDPVSPGPGSMFVLIAGLYWLGFAIAAHAVARRSVPLGVALALLALTPPAAVMLAMIWRDMLFAGVWLVAGAIVYATAHRRSRALWVVQASALALIGFGILLRPNAIAAAPFLAAYALWPERFRCKRMALLFVPFVVAGYALIHLVYYGLLDVKREHPLHSIMVFDLGGITHFTGKNQFPVDWSAEETRQLTSTCYNPERWDSYWTIEPCRFVMARLERTGDVIFGTPQLTKSWLHAVSAHPLAYLQHRADYFWTLLAKNVLTLELYRLDEQPALNNRAFNKVLALHASLRSTALFRLGLWLALATAGAALAWPRRETASGTFAISLSLSGAFYVLSFAPIGVAAEFRYGYWCVLASLAGVVAALAARREFSATGGHA